MLLLLSLEETHNAWLTYGGPQRQYTNIFYITALYILVHKHIHWLRGYIYQYNEIYTSTTILYPSTEMLISVQKYKLQYGKISPILSTQITAPVKKISISQYKNISSGTNIFIGCATRFFSTVKFMYTTVQQYLSQYKNINLSTKKNGKKNITIVQQCVSQYRNVNFSTKIKVSVQKNIF